MIYTEQHRELMRSVTKFIEAEINPHAEEWEKEGIFPAHELFKKMGDAGLLFDPTSVTSIKQVILEIVRDPEAARLLGRKGRDRMQAMTPERYGAQLQDLLRALR